MQFEKNFTASFFGVSYFLWKFAQKNKYSSFLDINQKKMTKFQNPLYIRVIKIKCLSFDHIYNLGQGLNRFVNADFMKNVVFFIKTN